MPHKFERVRMEIQADGSVNIGLAIVGTGPDEGLPQHAEWARCSVAHTHGWDECDVAGLFNLREKRSPAEGQPEVDVPGTSPKERAEAWLDVQRAKRGQPREVPLPTRQVDKVVDGKTVKVTEPIKDTNI